MANKTAVEFLFSELERCQYFIGNDIYEAYKKAIEMEKEQMSKSNNYDTTTGLPEEDSKRRGWHY